VPGASESLGAFRVGSPDFGFLTQLGQAAAQDARGARPGFLLLVLVGFLDLGGVVAFSTSGFVFVGPQADVRDWPASGFHPTTGEIKAGPIFGPASSQAGRVH